MNLKTSARQEPTRRRPASGPARTGQARSYRPTTVVLHAAVIALAILPASCNNSPYPNEDANANAMYSSIGGELTHLDPALTYGGGSDMLACIVETPFQYNYVDRPYKLDPLLATEVPKLEYRKIEFDGNMIEAPVYTIRLRRGVIYQNHPCFVESNRHLTDEDLRGVRTVNDFKKTATREMVAADFVYGVHRLCDPRLEFPGYSAFASNLLGFPEYNAELKKRLEAVREKRRAAAGLLYNQEIDEQFNPIEIDFSKDSDRFPFIREVDKYTFEVVLSQPYPQILYWMAFGFVCPVPPEAVEFYNQRSLLELGITFSLNPVGTGPYVLESYDPTNEVVLARNPNFREVLYPSLSPPGPDAHPEVVANYKLMKDNGMLEDSGKPLPFVDRIIWRMEKESIPRWNKFLQGYYDNSGIQQDSFDQAVSLSSKGDLSITDEMRGRGIKLIKTDTASFSYYAFNMQDPVFGGLDPNRQKLRQAISIAVDAQEKLDIFSNGLGTPAQHPLPPGIFGNEPGEAGMNPYVFRWDPLRKVPIRRDIKDAKKLLAEAGYPDGYGPDGHPLVIKFLSTAVSPESRSQLMLLRKQLARINVRMETEDCDHNVYWKKIREGGFQFARFGWLADYPDPETFFILFNTPDANTVDAERQNQAMYDNPRFNKLYEQMSRMENSPERAVIIREMLQTICKDAPSVFESHGVAIALTQSWLHNYYTFPLARNTAKYLRVDVPQRAAYRKKYNAPNYWPLVVILVALLAVTMPAVLATRRHLRER